MAKPIKNCKSKITALNDTEFEDGLIKFMIDPIISNDICESVWGWCEPSEISKADDPSYDGDIEAVILNTPISDSYSHVKWGDIVSVHCSPGSRAKCISKSWVDEYIIPHKARE